MKVIAILNWILIGLYGSWVLYMLLNPSRSGGDAATRGLDTALAYVVAFVLVVFFGLNLLPYTIPKVIILILMLAPGLLLLSRLANQYLDSRTQGQVEVARANGSIFFNDKPRRDVAAAIGAADTTRLRQLLQQPVPHLDEPGHYGTTLLDFAGERAATSQNITQMMACLKLLIDHGATIQGADPQHVPTHFRVCKHGPAVLLKWFLNKGADPNFRPAGGNPILIEVMRYGDDPLEKVRLLLDRGADPNAVMADDETTYDANYSPLMYAAREQMWDICQLLLKQGANPAYRTPKGDDLKKIMAQHAELYADVDDTPPAYTVFKKLLESHTQPRPE
ncbi:ankyrin repeat domain-containing protein [Larkinella punicea]|uniref:Ankyrin repeat domain-containing protein n=1 Tax=Larkinella punicea TaxID=2315727 RepID=A0A368JTR3_9BACT|nr:ankyrin repeat domain-containing protein [Larkinella punicea]RCR70336.1 ankyrin repeat domain-containing protein [Larkinella punicea]